MTRKRVYIILAILAAAGFFLQLITLPMIGTSKTTRAELSERNAYLKDREAIIKKIAELEEEKAQWENQIKKLDTAIPTESGLATVIFQLQNFAMDSGLIMKEIGHNEQPSSTLPGGMDLSINSRVIGSYASLKSFFGKLENNLRITDIQRLDLGLENMGEGTSSTSEGAQVKETASRGEQLFNASFTVKLYYFPTEKASAK
jgi:Tfp pilus assembly protein PilO